MKRYLVRKIKNFLLMSFQLLSAILGFILFLKTGALVWLPIFILLPLIVVSSYRLFKWYRWNKMLRKSNMLQIDKMDGIVFEHYLKELFKSQGYKVRVTKQSGDFGADLILEKGKEIKVIQAKRYNRNVGVRAIQEVRSAIDHYNAHEGWVITNSYYTNEAKKLAETNHVYLIDRPMLMNMILQLNAEEVPEPKISLHEGIEETVFCKDCGNKMILRKSRRGYFYGCESYPACRYTENHEAVSL